MLQAKERKILEQHTATFKITQTSDGRWRTFLPNEQGKRGKEVRKPTKEALERAVIVFYQSKSDVESMTFKTCYDAWSTHHFALNSSDNNTKSRYQTDYNRFLKDTTFESTPISRITDMDVDEFLMGMIDNYVCGTDRKLTYKSFTRVFDYVAGTFRYAQRRRWITENPMSCIEKKDYRHMCRRSSKKTAESELIPDDSFTKLLNQLYDDMKNDPEYFPAYAVEFAAMTGMRVGEVAALKWSDFDLSSMTFTISRTDHYDRITGEWEVREETKTGKERTFPIDDVILRSLNRIKMVQEDYGLTSEYLFPHPKYGWTHSNIISSCIKNKCKQLGFERTYGIHALRKTLNSDMRSNGATALICSGMLGNTVEVNNEHYTYDISKMEEKREYVAQAHTKRCFA